MSYTKKISLYKIMFGGVIADLSSLSPSPPLSLTQILQTVVLDIVNSYDVVGNASLKQTFTLLLWNYKQRDYQIQCKVLNALEKVRTEQGVTSPL